MSARVGLHDQMGAGICHSHGRSLQQDQVSRKPQTGLLLFQKAVRPSKMTMNPLRNAVSCGIFAGCRDHWCKSRTDRLKYLSIGDYIAYFVIAMRECLTNSVRHADLQRSVTCPAGWANSSLLYTNNGIPQKLHAPEAGSQPPPAM